MGWEDAEAGWGGCVDQRKGWWWSGYVGNGNDWWSRKVGYWND